MALRTIEPCPKNDSPASWLHRTLPAVLAVLYQLSRDTDIPCGSLVDWRGLRTTSDSKASDGLDHMDYIGESGMAVCIRLELDLYRTLLYG